MYGDFIDRGDTAEGKDESDMDGGDTDGGVDLGVSGCVTFLL